MKVIAKSAMVILSFVMIQSAAFGQTLTTDQVLAKMEQSNKNFPSIQADIQRTQYTNVLGKLKGMPQTGKIWILASGNAPRRIKADFDKPVKELFLIDKGMMLHFYPGEKTGETRSVNKDNQAEAQCIFFGLCEPGPILKENYDISLVGDEVVDGVKTTHLTLKPRDPKRISGILLVDLWLDSGKWYAIQTRVTESNKNYTNVKFSNFQTGKFSESIFKVDVPRDAQIQTIK